MDKKKIFHDLQTILSIDNIKENEPLKNYTYTKLGGKADFLLFPTTYEEVQKIIQYTKKHSVPLTILGHGANVIVKDGGIRGVVVNLSNMLSLTCRDDQITAQSGASIIDVSKFALQHELSGLEFACGIPGSVGGALYMNAGAYGGEISDVLLRAVVLTNEGEILHLEKADLKAEYRTSTIAKMGYIALEATFQLKKDTYEHIKGKMDDLTEQRESKQPLEYPSCGSVFKRPPGYFAGKLIQDSGLQGKQIGGAQISTKHAGFMVNVDQATATDYINLIQFAQATVKEKFGVDLETEVRIIGEDVE